MYYSNEVSKKIKELAKGRKVTVKQILSEAGLSNNFMAGLTNSMPKADNLAKIADELDCSVDYLLGRTENPQSHKAQSTNTVNGNYNAVGSANSVTVNNVSLNEHQKLLMNLYNKLSPIEQVELISDLHNRTK